VNYRVMYVDLSSKNGAGTDISSLEGAGNFTFMSGRMNVNVVL